MSVILVGCSASSSSQPKEVAKLEQRIAELEDENAELKEKLKEETNITDETETQETEMQETETETVEEEKESVSPLQVGEVIETERMEITIKNIEFSYDVLPDDTSSFYTHYEAESGSVYIHIDTDVKNLQKQN